MSREETPDDAAKTRAEDRAERELQLKIETLELERDKFKHTYWQGYADRFSAASVRGTAALLFANGTSLLLSFTSYKSLIDTFPADVLKRSAYCLFAGFVIASVAFVCALILSARPFDYTKKRDRGYTFFMWMCGTLALASFATLGIALLQPVVFLRTH